MMSIHHSLHRDLAVLHPHWQSLLLSSSLFCSPLLSHSLCRVSPSSPVPPQRFMYELKGVRLGPPRLPLAPLTPEQKAALEADLRAIGYFEWCD